MKRVTEQYRIAVYFFIFSLGLIISFVFVDITFFSGQLEKTIMQNASTKIKEREKFFSRYFDTPRNILNSTRQSEYFNKYLDSPTVYKTELNDIFLTMVSINTQIMQFRYIDADGKEKIRIDRKSLGLKANIVKDEFLQNKSNRYYFKDSKTKELDKVWFSNIDLNIERGQIIKPYIPTLRAMLPIKKNGKFSGVLIINYFMSDAIRKLFQTPLYDMILLNDRGFPLVHYNKKYNWSFYQKTKYSISNDPLFDWKKIALNDFVINDDFVSKKLNLDTPEKLILILQLKKSYLLKSQKEKLYEYTIVSSIIMILSFFMSYIFSKYLRGLQFIIDDTKKSNKYLEKKVDAKTKELQDLNENLEKKVEDEIRKNKEKEEQLFAQAKLAAMGDMIGNIAHQWRQPLSMISTNASGIKIKYEFGQLDVSELPKEMDIIVEKTKYLSNTIDTFRNFLIERKEYKEIVLQENINMAVGIVSSSLQDNFIELKNDTHLLPSIKLHTISAELCEVIINIINNAKDILLEKNISDAWIKIGILQFSNKVTITIEDNAGGIPKSIFARIFEPYFTTKHKSQGTGLGLHMSYKIITESLHGKLYVKNTSNGAKFFIELPFE